MFPALEICAGSLQSALTAQKGGADRIELCDNLFAGGTTPSFGMIKTVLSLVGIPVFPIIRPRGGDFVYSDEEFEVIKQDLARARNLGCKGAAVGILVQDGRVDKVRCAELMGLAGAMELTFHRAFDRCPNQSEAMEDIIALGFRRVLTSGGEASAPQGVSALKELIRQASGRIIVMPGGGLHSDNLENVLLGTGATEFHGTAKSAGISSADQAGSDPYQTHLDIVRAMKAILRRYPH